MVSLGAAFGDDIAETIDRLDWWVTLAIVAAIAGWFVDSWIRARCANARVR
jgi:hypothetical protein